MIIGIGGILIDGVYERCGESSNSLMLTGSPESQTSTGTVAGGSSWNSLMMSWS